MFKQIHIAGWRQFREASIDFHPKLTVLTGANGSGKTTLLSILSRHFGWSSYFVSTSRITRRGAYRYFSGSYLDDELDEPGQEQRAVGEIIYEDGTQAQLFVPPQVDTNFEVTIQGQQHVPGIYLPSHRPVYSYRRVDSIPTKIDANNQLFDAYIDNLRRFYTPNPHAESPSYRLKASLISLAVFGEGNSRVARNEEAVSTFEGFEELLKLVLPPKIGFTRLAVRMPDIVFECSSGDFSLDAASGGVAAIVDLSWQIYMRSLLDERFVVLADEPENHLHPELQRSLLPGLMQGFPHAQFIVATHNPFMVTSVADSSVYILDFVDGRVEASSLPSADRTGSPNQILMDVLGVPFPVPLWVESQVESIVRTLSDQDLSVEGLRAVKDKMTALGMGHLFPEVIERLPRRPA